MENTDKCIVDKLPGMSEAFYASSRTYFETESEHIEFIRTASKVFYVSQFVLNQITLHPDLIISLMQNQRLFTENPVNHYLKALNNHISKISNQNQFDALLRSYRNQEMVRIAWRDISGWASIAETMLDISLLAEAIINTALDFLFINACKLYGTPYDSSGRIQRLIVLGMGKLGAWELNFSSDIDLIFCYEDEGQLENKKNTSFFEFYSKLIHTFIKSIDTVTEHGFVFRIDTRLRPFGESGPIVINFEGMENYYQGHAREWERYAMIKARVVAGDRESANRLQSIISSFVYRRYLDYRALGEIRLLKKQISHELLRKDRKDDIKLGYGGIREIEFIGQVFQLVRGGQIRLLRERSILNILDSLSLLGYLPQDLICNLKESYQFLRLVENRIQQYDDKQTHVLPTSDRQRLSLAYGLGFSNWTDFVEKLNSIREKVHDSFCHVFEQETHEIDDYKFIDIRDFDSSSVDEFLRNIGIEQPEVAIQILLLFTQSYSIRSLSERGCSELNRLLPIILKAVVHLENPLESLTRLLQLIEVISGRNVYFTLLIENPSALSQLVKLSSASSWIINYIAESPLLLDELIDPNNFYTPLSRQQLMDELDRCLQQVDILDIEQLLTSLRKFKRTYMLRIAVNDLLGSTPVTVISDYLTWLAECLLSYVLLYAWKLTVKRHGPPPHASDEEIKGFGVIAYGKLGGMELSYASDLDLVFLYGGVHDSTLTLGENPIPCEQFYARVVKRMMMILTTHIHTGILYEIDLRLRPSGHSGLLVTSMEAYEHYQMNNAWTWEQQALVRARFLTGDPSIEASFNLIRHRSLCRMRDYNLLRLEVIAMRDKMREKLEVKIPGRFDLKQSSGCIADIEFIVQFGVLVEAHQHPLITQWTDVIHLLNSFKDFGFLTLDAINTLCEGYRLFRKQSHRAALLEQSATGVEGEFTLIRSRINDIWRDKIGS